MATAIEDDEFEEDPAGPAKQPPAHTATAGVDKTAATQEERMLADISRVKERRCSILMGAFVVLLLILFLAMLASMLFLGPDPDVPFTPATHRIVTNENETIEHPVTDNVTDINATGILDSLHYDYQAGSAAVMDTNSSVVKLFCATAECQATVRLLENQLDPSRDPCSNLYDHVCSTWQQEHEALAEENGRISVDDVVADRYLDSLIALLADDSTESSEWSSLLQDCVNGSLFTEDDVTDILKIIPLTGNNSMEGIAKAIAEMAFLGVSPFFDVVSNVINGTVYVTLLSPSSSQERISDSVSSADVERHGSLISESDSGAKSAFVDAIGRQLCFQINRMVGSAKNCSLRPASKVTPPWNHRWYETTGLQRLSKSAESVLQSFSAFTERNTLSVGDGHLLPSHLDEANGRLRSCLRLIDRHDSSQLRTLVARSTLPTFQQGAKEALRSLKASLDETFQSASNISMVLGPAPALQNETHNTGYESRLHAGQPANGDSKLKRLLHSTTWSEWNGHRDKRSGALSTASSFAKSSSTLYVPLPVFNATFVEDHWLQALSLARIGPRTLKTLFLGSLGPELYKSRLSKCVSDRKSGRRSTVARSTAGIDMEEVASFYVALRAYRRQVGEAMAISGSLLNSDSLFLLYYVFNNCEAVTDNRGAHSDGPLGRRRRRLVDSVTATFSSVLFEQCQAPLDPPGCDFESQNYNHSQLR
ncbi:hypothetical protein V5799_016109 [Amblyomma americanum]|uniref:Uncharacterized protein n=1 Tax=Amblyomma americanum TaxID=6943 RepID=A0AAQ4F5Z3_AMBAM